MKTYHQRVVENYKLQEWSQRELMKVLQRICPGFWVMQIFAVGMPVQNPSDNSVIRIDDGYRVEVSNGDDNVTVEGKNLGATIARVIAFLLDGSVFPLGGNCGAYISPKDRTEDEQGESK